MLRWTLFTESYGEDLLNVVKSNEMIDFSHVIIPNNSTALITNLLNFALFPILKANKCK